MLKFSQLEDYNLNILLKIDELFRFCKIVISLNIK